MRAEQAAVLSALLVACGDGRRDGHPPGGADQRIDGGVGTSPSAPSLCADGAGNVLVAWATDAPVGRDLWWIRSPEDGAPGTWVEPPGRLWTGVHEWALTCAEDAVHILWTGPSPEGLGDAVWLATSPDHGDNWTEATRLDSGTEAKRFDPHVRFALGEVCATWVEDWLLVQVKCSADEGATWSDLLTPDADDGSGSSGPRLARGDAWIAVWGDSRVGTERPYAARLSPGAEAFDDPVQLDRFDDEDASTAWSWLVTAGGSDAYAVWGGSRGDDLNRIFLVHSEDGGLTWDPTPEAVSLGSGEAVWPAAAQVGDALQVAWVVLSGGAGVLMTRHYASGFATMTELPVADAVMGTLAGDGTRSVLVWQALSEPGREGTIWTADIGSDGVPGSPRMLSDTGREARDLQVALAANALHATWTASDGNVRGVYFAAEAP